jgi:DNA polymerase I-like protein with 3'-5' exonuclease and polymerase domains
MHIITSDYECTTSNKGNPFDRTNIAVALAFKIGERPSVCFDPYESISKIQIEQTPETLFVFFNAKFDLHWHRKCGLPIPSFIWCCQLAEFYLDGQRRPYPSLEDTAKRYNLGEKLDVVKTQYWDKGIDTKDIPWNILSEYACKDVDLTYLIFLKQYERFKQNRKLYALFTLACQDLLILEEMEWNGLCYSESLCATRATEIKEKLGRLDLELASVYPDLDINFNSGDQLSAFLYGGNIVRSSREPMGVFKTGPNKGETKFKLVEVVHTLPRLIEPLPRSELQKEGYYQTDEGTLRKLKGKAAKKWVPLLLERAKLDKLLGTYYEGIPKLAKQMHWEDKYVHGQFNQVVAATGRLSSSKPNLQNFAGDIEDVFVTRFAEETPCPTEG